MTDVQGMPRQDGFPWSQCRQAWQIARRCLATIAAGGLDRFAPPQRAADSGWLDVPGEARVEERRSQSS